MADQRGLFDLDERCAALSKAGDPLERLAAAVDFEVFQAERDAALRQSDRAKGGRPLFNAVLMFQVLILQALYGLSDGEPCRDTGQVELRLPTPKLTNEA